MPAHISGPLASALAAAEARLDSTGSASSTSPCVTTAVPATEGAMREIPTRALSILQPWAHAIVHLGKRIENREWRNGCSYRGEILIHASKWPTAGERSESFAEFVGQAQEVARIANATNAPRSGPFTLNQMLETRGRIIGRARIVGEVFVDMTGKPRVCDGADRGIETRDLTETERAWWTGGFALVLADVSPVSPVPCRGALGLWDVPEEVRAAITRAT